MEGLRPKIEGAENFSFGEDILEDGSEIEIKGESGIAKISGGEYSFEEDEEDEEEGLDFDQPEQKPQITPEEEAREIIKHPKKKETESALRELFEDVPKTEGDFKIIEKQNENNKNVERMKIAYATNLPDRKDRLKQIMDYYTNEELITPAQENKIREMGKVYDKNRESFQTKFKDPYDRARYASIGTNQNEIPFLIQQNKDHAQVLIASLKGAPNSQKVRKAMETISHMDFESSALGSELIKDLIDLKLQEEPELIETLPEQEQVEKAMNNPDLTMKLSENAKKALFNNIDENHIAEFANKLDSSEIGLLANLEKYRDNPAVQKKLEELSMDAGKFLTLDDNQQAEILRKAPKETRQAIIESAVKYAKRSDVSLSDRAVRKKLEGMVA
jgi:hypothetical protein